MTSAKLVQPYAWHVYGPINTVTSNWSAKLSLVSYSMHSTETQKHIPKTHKEVQIMFFLKKKKFCNWKPSFIIQQYRQMFSQASVAQMRRE